VTEVRVQGNVKCLKEGLGVLLVFEVSGEGRMQSLEPSIEV